MLKITTFQTWRDACKSPKAHLFLWMTPWKPHRIGFHDQFTRSNIEFLRWLIIQAHVAVLKNVLMTPLQSVYACGFLLQAASKAKNALGHNTFSSDKCAGNVPSHNQVQKPNVMQNLWNWNCEQFMFMIMIMKLLKTAKTRTNHIGFYCGGFSNVPINTQFNNCLSWWCTMGALLAMEAKLSSRWISS